MINFRIKESAVNDLFDVEFIVDTGTTVVSVTPGLVEAFEVEEMLDDVQEQIDLIRKRVM